MNKATTMFSLIKSPIASSNLVCINFRANSITGGITTITVFGNNVCITNCGLQAGLYIICLQSSMYVVIIAYLSVATVEYLGR